MARNELDTSDIHDTFNIPRWHEEVALWLDFWALARIWCG
jgi:hypothetical protein